MPPAFTLCYFDLLAKGLPVAMVAAHSGLEWAGKDRETFDWKSVKATSAPFEQMPLLFVPDLGGRVVAQSTAISSVIARMAGPERAYDGGADDEDFAVSAMLLAEAEDLYTNLQKGQATKYVALGEGGKTQQLHDELWAESGKIARAKHFRCLERMAKPADAVGPARFTSGGATCGEMYLWGMLRQIALLKPDVFAPFPKLRAFYERILEHPRTKEVLDGTSPMGAMAEYFVK